VEDSGDRGSTCPSSIEYLPAYGMLPRGGRPVSTPAGTHEWPRASKLTIALYTGRSVLWGKLWRSGGVLILTTLPPHRGSFCLDGRAGFGLGLGPFRWWCTGTLQRTNRAPFDRGAPSA
jgi:hypothetical protein